MIVGASGVIGGSLLRAARERGIAALGTAKRRLDGGLAAFDMSAQPLRTVVPDLGRGDTVFLLAGYVAPAWIFANPEAARRLNLDASRRLVDEVEGCGGRVIFMSTDQVFDGESGGYLEDADTRPLNLYGRLKADMESHVLATRAGVVARTGWNVGWVDGQHCAVLQCYETLLRPGARMARDNLFNVTDVDDTARGLLAITEAPSERRRIYHLVSSPAISRADLAAQIKSESLWGAAMNFETVDFAAITYSEPRPTRAFLSSRSAAELGVVFAPPAAIISRKIGLIDQARLDASATPVTAAVRSALFKKH